MFAPDMESSIDKIMDQGDRFYRTKQYKLAFMAYTEALEYEKQENKNKSNRKQRLKCLYAKRSLSCLKLAEYKKCLEDAQCACKYHEEGDPQVVEEMKKLKVKIIENHMKTDINLANISELSEFMEHTPLEIDENKIINTTFDEDEEDTSSDSSKSSDEWNMAFQFSMESNDEIPLSSNETSREEAFCDPAVETLFSVLNHLNMAG